MKKILITGASGWLGINLIKAFLNGIDLYDETQNLSDKTSINIFIPKSEHDKLYSLFRDKINYYYGDIKNKNECENFTKNFKTGTIFHLVGIIHPKKISELYEINYKGTKNICEASINAGLEKIIILSSNSPFGLNINQNSPFHENSNYNPYLNYGRSKMLMENYVKEIERKKLIHTVLIRAMWFYGPYQPDRQNLFFEMINKGKVPLVGSGNNLRSMSNTENLSYGLILASIKKNANGNVYWIADKRPYSQMEIINTVRAVLREEFNIISSKKVIKLPNILSTIAYYLDHAIQNVGLYNSKLHVLTELNKNIFCTINKAEEDLGYKPKIDLKIGLKRNFEWMKTNNKLNF
jgi:nucleoside-diphosphate-sugar epimerase